MPCIILYFFIGTKLSEDCRKYGSENTCTSGNTLSKAAVSFSRARAAMEKERGNLLKTLGTQVTENIVVCYAFIILIFSIEKVV